MKLTHIFEIQGSILTLTGLHIGGGKDSVEIGGMDQPIIKHPINGQPYIPGSSLKGKMRSMLETVFFSEMIEKNSRNEGMPIKEDCPVTRIFGTSNDQKPAEMGPTRIAMRDAYLSQEDTKDFEEGKLMMEEKYEVAIDRIRGTALKGALRPIERVPSGVRFTLSITLKQYEGDGEELLDLVKKGLRLIELDGLGGGISRGSGQVIFENLRIDGNPFELPQTFEVSSTAA